MLEINVPNQKKYTLKYLVLDYNGTLACDGILIQGVKDILNELSEQLQIHVITADTFGNVKLGLTGVNCITNIIDTKNQAQAKLEYIKRLGPQYSVCIGNGQNDYLMLKESALSIVVVQSEGAVSNSISVSDIVCINILSALSLLKHPKRIIATLRS